MPNNNRIKFVNPARWLAGLNLDSSTTPSINTHLASSSGLKFLLLYVFIKLVIFTTTFPEK